MTELQTEILKTMKNVHDGLMRLEKLFAKAEEQEPETVSILLTSHPLELMEISTLRRQFLEFGAIATDKMEKL